MLKWMLISLFAFGSMALADELPEVSCAARLAPTPLFDVIDQIFSYDAQRFYTKASLLQAIDDALDSPTLDINAKNAEGRTALMQFLFLYFTDNNALLLPESTIYHVFTRILHTPGLNINEVDLDNRTALMVASGTVRVPPVVLKDLLAFPGLDPNIRDALGYNPLMRVSHNYWSMDARLTQETNYFDPAENVYEKMHLEKAKMLLKFNPGFLNEQNELGLTAPMLAVQRSRWLLFELMVDHPDMDFQVRDSLGDTLWIKAAKQRVPEYVAYLIPKLQPADINAKNNLGRTALIEVIADDSIYDGASDTLLTGRTETVLQALLKSPHHNLLSTDNSNRTVWFYSRANDKARRKEYGAGAALAGPGTRLPPLAGRYVGYSLPLLKAYAAIYGGYDGFFGFLRNL